MIVHHLGNVHVADYLNHRIMRWLKGSKEGTIIVEGKGEYKHCVHPDLDDEVFWIGFARPALGAIPPLMEL